MLVWKLARQIWTYNLFLMGMRQWHLCQYISKTQAQCSQAMKQAVKETFEGNMLHHGTMIAKACLSNWEYLVQEAVYHILLELKLRKIFQVLLSEKELDKLPDDGPRFSRDHILIVKYGKTKCNILLWKNSVLNVFVMQNI